MGAQAGRQTDRQVGRQVGRSLGRRSMFASAVSCACIWLSALCALWTCREAEQELLLHGCFRARLWLQGLQQCCQPESDCGPLGECGWSHFACLIDGWISGVHVGWQAAGRGGACGRAGCYPKQVFPGRHPSAPTHCLCHVCMRQPPCCFPDDHSSSRGVPHSSFHPVYPHPFLPGWICAWQVRQAWAVWHGREALPAVHGSREALPAAVLSSVKALLAQLSAAQHATGTAGNPPSPGTTTGLPGRTLLTLPPFSARALPSPTLLALPSPILQVCVAGQPAGLCWHPRHHSRPHWQQQQQPQQRRRRR